LLTGCEEPASQPSIRPVIATRVGSPEEFNQNKFTGQAKPSQEVNLAFRVEGPLVALPVAVGDEVKKGDVIAKIDPRDYEVNLRNVEGSRQRGEAQLTRAEADLRRLNNIYREDPGATSQVAIDRARETRDSAKADVASLVAATEAATDALGYTQLAASFDGTIVATYVENFENVQAKQPIARLVDTSKVEMIVNIPEGLISHAGSVERIDVVFDSFPDVTLSAEIREIGREASDTTRTYPVTLVMEQPEGIVILPGMAGTARGTEQLREGEVARIILPGMAVAGDQTGTSYVWTLISEGDFVIAHRADVTVGRLTSLGVEVTSGVKPGDLIAVAGVNVLREGQKVRVSLPGG
jgi:RND family efflux transporter MFP subunit